MTLRPGDFGRWRITPQAVAAMRADLARLAALSAAAHASRQLAFDFDADPPAADCDECGGDGEVDCPTCQGQGRDECPTCDGHGRIDCPTCQGGGDDLAADEEEP